MVTFPTNSSDPRYSQMMNQRQSIWNSAPFQQQNAALSVSQVEPRQYQSLSIAQPVRSNAWEPPAVPKNNEMNGTNTNSQSE